MDSTALSTYKHKILEELLEMLTLNMNDKHTYTHKHPKPAHTISNTFSVSVLTSCFDITSLNRSLIV